MVNGLSVLLVHVVKKSLEKEDNHLQVMIKRLHELHSREKSENRLDFVKNKSQSYNLRQISEGLKFRLVGFHQFSGVIVWTQPYEVS